MCEAFSMMHDWIKYRTLALSVGGFSCNRYLNQCISLLMKK